MVFFAAGVHSSRPSYPYVVALGASEIPGLLSGGCAELIPAGVVLSSPARDVLPDVEGGALPGGSSRNGDPGVGRRFLAHSAHSGR
ncbi:hypothetical protein [Actinoplanes sp. ATCC 53533]|uniref:hypothetical protein n=1 Tax=Actinoplanes sp. ATCC 53533 TaxID=1288362 RepID=UPI001315184A|nr:hypothetical protein [Actinoplanes sp. ATCC 53533]